ncbi:MAG: ParA family protein [Blastocatellia bacterium]|nr:ParA family protein [Blastocatellia bacterium]
MLEQTGVPSGAERLQREILGAPLKEEPAKVIAFVNQKGGTGKTTIAQNLAVCFGLRHNKRLLCIDLDPQGNLGHGLVYDQINNPKTADRLLVVPKVDIDEYIVSVRPNIDLIHNKFQKDLREAVDRLPLSPNLLRKQLGSALRRYDYVIIDTPAGLCRSTQVGIDAADQVVLVVSCGMYGLKGMIAVVDWMAGIQKRLAKPMPLIKVVLNNYDERRRFDREFIQEIQRIFGDDLFQTHIRTSTRIIEAAARGIAVIEYDNSCAAAQDFEWLSREFLGLVSAEECKHAAEGCWS